MEVKDHQSHTVCRNKTHLLSWYAPMFAALREQKEAFYDDLQAAINEIPVGERYIILSNFNAWVRSRHTKDNQWERARGQFSLGTENDAGKELVNFE